MTDNYRRYEMEARQREIAYQNGYADGKEDTQGELERLESAFKQRLKDAGEIQKTQAKGMSKLQAEIERLRKVLDSRTRQFVDTEQKLRAALRAVRDEIIYGGSDFEEPCIDKIYDFANKALKNDRT